MAHGDIVVRTRVKVCCIENPQALEAAVRAGADALGFVGPMPSGTGILDLGTAATLIARVPPGVTSFLLTSATDPARLVEEAGTTRAAVLQIVDRVPVDAYARLRREVPGLKIVQAVHVEDETALDEVLAVAPAVDAILLDSGSRKGPVARLGGTGLVHDWKISAAIVRRCPRPVWLAGGLDPANVADAVRLVRPFGVDVCTGLRRGDRLDEARLGAFIRGVAPEQAA